MTPTSQNPTETTTPATDVLPGPERIAELREEIDWLDGEILRLVKRRTEISKTIGKVRLANGGPRLVLNRENHVLARYRELGKEGQQLAMALLSLGRGPLGR
jgi:chorismate mutase